MSKSSKRKHSNDADTADEFADGSNRMELAPIPFKKRFDETEVSRANSTSFKMRQVPNDPESQNFEVVVQYFDDGEPEQWLNFISQVREVFRGQHCNAGPAQYALFRGLVKNTAAERFRQEAALSLIHI